MLNEQCTLWEYASKREFGHDLHVRHKASRLLCFVCIEAYAPVFVDPNVRSEIVKAYKADRKVICSWSIKSPSVDFIAQRIRIVSSSFDEFLDRHTFDEEMKNPSEKERVAWMETWRDSPL